MTFKEKWEQDHPGVSFNPIVRCPSFYGYEPADIDCANPKKVSAMARICSDCWNRVMSTYKIDEEHEKKLDNETAPMWPKENPRILDSGERRRFETGAVRDIQEGKGRCDLMPLEVICKYFKKPIFGLLGMFLKDCNTAHLYECIRLFSSYYGEETTPATDCTMFLEVAKHFEEGAKKYGENNWQKGLPVKCYIDSAVRHYLKWLRGDKDEPHDRAFVWNVLCCIWEVDFSPRAKDKTHEFDMSHILEKNVVGQRPNHHGVYICDRKACEKCDNPECHHTDDIRHAKNFEYVEGDTIAYVEKLRPEFEGEYAADEPIPLGDCACILFEFRGQVYAKISEDDPDRGVGCMNLRTGERRGIHPGNPVYPINICGPGAKP